MLSMSFVVVLTAPIIIPKTSYVDVQNPSLSHCANMQKDGFCRSRAFSGDSIFLVIAPKD